LGVEPDEPGMTGGGIRLMTYACWPMDQMLVVTQYSSTPIGKITPETANDSGST
jgi:hypothetical protein